MLGVGSAPQQSLAVFVILFALLAADSLRGRRGFGWPALLGGLVLGGLLAFASIRSAPPSPPVPTKPYDQPLDMCRPPYQLRALERKSARQQPTGKRGAPKGRTAHRERSLISL